MTMIRVIIKVATGVNTSYTPSDSFFIIRFFFPFPLYLAILISI